jgi:hypothetical protein
LHTNKQSNNITQTTLKQNYSTKNKNDKQNTKQKKKKTQEIWEKKPL